MKTLISTILLAASLTAISQTDPKKHGIDVSGGIPEGLKEGILAPPITGFDQYGQAVSLAERLKKGPVVLIFYRGYWCPVCNKYLGQFQAELTQILQKGASVIAVTPEANDGVEKTMAKNNLSFSVLSDEGYRIMDAYKVRFLVTDPYAGKIKTFLGTSIAENNNDDTPFLPIPATYIIGQDGKIKKVFFDQDYKNRPTVSEIVKYLD
jgi:peroxiredoxin